MDNSMTTWIIVALLVLLIGAAIFMLLRRPGGDDDSLDGRDAPAVDRDGDRRDQLDGRTAPEQTQAVAPEDRPASDDAPFDQSGYDQGSHDTGGATPVARPDETLSTDHHRATDEQRAADAHPADDFLGVDATGRDEVSTDPAFQDPRTDGHIIAEDAVDHDADRDRADRDEVGYHAAPAAEGYAARPADEQAYQEHPAGGVDRGHEQSAHGSHDGEPLTADEVLDARGVSDSDTGEGYAAAPVEPDRTQADRTQADRQRGDLDQGDVNRGDVDRSPDRRPDDVSAEREHERDDATTTGAFASGAGAPAAASAASAHAHVDEPVVEENRDEPAAGGAVFAESVYGPGSVEPAEDGSGPEGWEIKGNTGSMLFHTSDSPSYDAVRAEVWFDSEESARNAGFAHWDRRRR